MPRGEAGKTGKGTGLVSGANGNETAHGGADMGRADDIRKTRSIRFSESEWEEVRRAARAHDTPAAEFVRETTLAFARTPARAGADPIPPALIERIFRYTWFMATEKRDAMIREGRGEEVDRLVAEARTFHASLRGDAAD